MKKSFSLLFFFVSLFGVNESFAQCPTKVYVHNTVEATQTIELINENQEAIALIWGARYPFKGQEIFDLGSLSEEKKSRCKTNTKYSIRIKTSLYSCIYTCYHYGGDWKTCETDCNKKVKEERPIVLQLHDSKSEFDANSSTYGYVIK